MKVSFGEEVTRLVTYRLTVLTGTKAKLSDISFEKDSGSIIDIVFEDGEFLRCQFDFKDPYTLEQWIILGCVAERIEEIEASYRKKN